MILAFFTALIATIVLGRLHIWFFRIFKIGQTVRDDGPEAHLKKQGTPTIGGIIFLVPTAVIGFMIKGEYPQIMPVIYATLGFGAVGFIDDLVKVIRKNKNGVSGTVKMMLLIAVSVAFSVYLIKDPNFVATVEIPFIGTMVSQWFFILFTTFVLIAITNAANLTDGVDGLASGIAFVILMFFFMVAVAFPDYAFIKIIVAILAGGVVGFLFYNVNPAKLFMGDTGSLALGGALGAIAIVMKMPFIILLVGAVYVLECISVIIQVLVYKATKKRVFKMAPLHHHFELSGWSEKTVVLVFCLVTVILCVIGYFIVTAS